PRASVSPAGARTFFKAISQSIREEQVSEGLGVVTIARGARPVVVAAGGARVARDVDSPDRILPGIHTEDGQRNFDLDGPVAASRARSSVGDHAQRGAQPDRTRGVDALLRPDRTVRFEDQVI